MKVFVNFGVNIVRKQWRELLQSWMSGVTFKLLGAISLCIALLGISTSANAQSYSQLQNRWNPEYFIHIENGYAQAGPIQPGWESASWSIETVAGEPDYRRLRNSWQPEQYLNIENGSIQSGPIEPGWQSAMWIVEPVKGTAFFRLRNRWQSKQYLHIENGRLQSGSIGLGWHSAMWTIKTVN
jgi:hypothetical protein